MNVKDRAEAAGTFRHLNVFLMETLARWIPTTPEMEAKVMMGRHLWLLAQAADRLGRRARELRAPLHYTRAPDARFAAALSQLAALSATAERLEGFYGAALEAAENGYRTYLAATDRVIDEPSVVIVEEMLRDVERMRADRSGFVAEFPALREGTGGASHVRAAFAGAPRMIAAPEQVAQPA